MRPSDIVWTDGCCVYGDQSEGGSAPVIVSEEGCIPIFWQNGQHQLYQRHKLRDGILGTPHHRMVNRGSHVTFSDDPACLDVSIGRDGKTYLVKSGSYELPSEVYEGQAGVSGDGKMVMSSLDFKGLYRSRSGLCVKRNRASWIHLLWAGNSGLWRAHRHPYQSMRTFQRMV